VESHFVEDFSDYKGKSLTFKIVELDKEKNRLILSHKDVKLEQKEQKHIEIKPYESRKISIKQRDTVY